MTVEVVENVDEAITHINEYGSGHTDSIVTDNTETARTFSQFINSACVFHNGKPSLQSFCAFFC